MISADSHVVEPPEVVAGLAERFGDEAPRPRTPTIWPYSHDPGAGLAELEKAIDGGARTACIPCRAPAGRPYRHPDHEPIWAAAEEAGIPLAMHIDRGYLRSPTAASPDLDRLPSEY